MIEIFIPVLFICMNGNYEVYNNIVEYFGMQEPEE
jgi:hypothetical protein